jgi:hypothetical protein
VHLYDFKTFRVPQFYYSLGLSSLDLP